MHHAAGSRGDRGAGVIPIRLLNEYLLSTYFGPGAVLGAGDRSRSTTGLISAPEGIYILVGTETCILPGTRHT